jgi:hypothetical protein
MTTHKYKVGQPVDFRAGRFGVPASPREYKIMRLLPPDGDDPLYRIKSAGEPFERVARERELSSR